MANIFSAAWHHKKISVFIIIISSAAGWFYFNSGNKTVSATIYTYGTADYGMISQSVSGSGQVSVTDQVDVKSKVAGDVIAVTVSQGQQVKTGDVLAQLDQTDAQKAVRDDQISLESAKLTLQKMNQDNSLSLAQTENALTDAQDQATQSKSDLAKTYEQAFNTLSSMFADLPTIMSGMDDIITGSNSAVVQTSGTYFNYYQDAVSSSGGSLASVQNIGQIYTTAKNGYNNALNNYKNADRYSDQATISGLIDESSDMVKKISNAIKQLTGLVHLYRDIMTNNNSSVQTFSTTHLGNLNTYSSQVNSYLVTLLTTQESLKTATKNVADAQIVVAEKTQSLQSLKDFSNPLSIQSQQLSISQKENTLANDRQTLADCAIRSPFDGIIASVGVKKADSVTSGATIATVISQQQIATVSLNEVDVSGVKIGQKVTLTFDAVSDLTLTGHISEIDTIGTVSSGVVSYDVTIVFDTQDDRVKPGMSVTAAIITNTKQDVLLVPNSAVKSNAAGNYVLVPVPPVASDVTTGSSAEGQAAKQQTVTVGLSDDNNTEIVSGLNENDTIVTKTATSTSIKTSTSSSSNSVFRFLSGGGGPGGEPARSTNSGSSGSSTSKSSTSSGSSNSSNPPDTGPGLP